MSFIQKLISLKSSRKQSVQKPASEAANRDVYTKDEEDFVHIYPSLSGSSTDGASSNVGGHGNGNSNNADEENADISKWEMAEVLSERNKVIVDKTENKNKEETLERLRRHVDRPDTLARATVTADTRPCMEDSLELEKFDDKAHRVIKGSQRRKYL